MATYTRVEMEAWEQLCTPFLKRRFLPMDACKGYNAFKRQEILLAMRLFLARLNHHEYPLPDTAYAGPPV